jgi:hypothetical protein
MLIPVHLTEPAGADGVDRGIGNRPGFPSSREGAMSVAPVTIRRRAISRPLTLGWPQYSVLAAALLLNLAALLTILLSY